MASSIIVVDIGNTSTQTALERAGRFVSAKRIPSRRQTSQMTRKLLDFYARRYRIDGAILCSVVPRLDRGWLNELRRITRGPVLRVNHKLNLGVGINYPRPAEIGADRLANAAAAVARYGAPVIVADFGTALTFDVITADGAYAGGIIAPGPMLFTEYLAEKTALLPRLSLPFIRKAVQGGKLGMIGKNTRQAMLIGLRSGYPGMVKEIIARLKQERGLQNARLCATGGWAETVLAGTDLKITIDPQLTLRGISRIYRLNPDIS